MINGLKPERVFYYFEQISNIPRGSGNEKEISDYLLNFGKSLGLESIQDEALNVIIKKPLKKINKLKNIVAFFKNYAIINYLW